MLRICQSTPDTLALSGELSNEWVAELERSCAQILDDGRTVTLDFTHVAFIDRAGIELLVALHRRGARLINCSAFQREQIRQAGAAIDS